MKNILYYLFIGILSINLIFADNGIWHFASDVRPGTFGEDEGLMENYSFKNEVHFYKNVTYKEKELNNWFVYDNKIDSIKNIMIKDEAITPDKVNFNYSGSNSKGGFATNSYNCNADEICHVNSLKDIDVGTIRDNNGGWIRTYGNTGWYSQTYGGGWYMIDSSFIRAYNNKNIYTGGIIRSDSSLRSPIFYDQDNTGYYVNPASTSNLNRVLVNRYPPTDSRDVATKRYVDSKVSSSGWPAGSYCIWKNGACPSGFSHRSMTLDVGTHSHDMSPNEGPIGSSYATGSTRSWFYFHACCK